MVGTAAAVGKTALVSYEADYFFYRAHPAHGQDHDATAGRRGDPTRRLEPLDEGRRRWAGQTAGGVREILPVAEIMRRLVDETEAALARAPALH